MILSFEVKRKQLENKKDRDWLMLDHGPLQLMVVGLTGFLEFPR